MKTNLMGSFQDEQAAEITEEPETTEGIEQSLNPLEQLLLE